MLWFTVLINLNLAVLNLLPIPVLDGGHMLIATIQRFTKGLLSNKAVIILQYTFMALLFSLMAYISCTTSAVAPATANSSSSSSCWSATSISRRTSA